MLVLARKIGEEVVVPQCGLTMTILEVTRGHVRLGITAPPHLAVHRREVSQRLQIENKLDMEGIIMSKRILIADADAFLANSYRKYLAQYGTEVTIATNALECLNCLRQAVPDVLVLDPALLWGGGDGLLALLHEEPEIRPAAVILLAQGGNRRLLYQLSHFKVDDYQTKPMSPRRLMEQICLLHRPPARASEPSPATVPQPLTASLVR